MTQKKFRLTVQEQIMVHLNEFKNFDEQLLEVPFGVTQEGVANAIGVVRSAIPRAMKRLVEKGYVKEDVAHITDLTRRRKVYFLTLEGLMQTHKLIENLEKLKIKIQDLEGGPDELIELFISEVNKHLSSNFQLLRIIQNLSPDYILDIERLTKPELETEPEVGTDTAISSDAIAGTDEGLVEGESRELVDFTSKAPKSLYFVGRENELEQIKDWLDNSPNKIVIIHGIAGIGKTTLMSKLLEEYKPHKNVFWYRFHEWDNLRNILTPLSEFLSQMNKQELKNYLEGKATLDLNEVADIIEEMLNESNSLLFIDDFHRVGGNDNIIGLITLITEMLERIEGIKLIIASRSIIPFYDRREVVIKKLIAEMALKGLDEEGSKELLKLRALKDVDQEPVFKSIYNLTQGHPLSLELIDGPDAIKELKDQKNINLYIEEEIFLKLTDIEKKILQIASLHRYPTVLEGLLIFSELSYEVLAKLLKKSLVVESAEGYEVHEIIKDFFYSHLSPDLKEELHLKIGEFYLSQLEKTEELLAKGRISIEAQHHFLNSGRQDKLAEVAVKMGADLIEQGYFEELLETLNKLDTDRLDQRFLFDIDILKGDIFTLIGKYQLALEHYNSALARPESELEEYKIRIVELYRKIGQVNDKMRNWDDAVENFQKSLELSEKYGDIKGITDALGGLGWVYWKKKDYELANQYFDKCMRKAEMLEDLPGKAKIFMGLGITSAQQGNLEDAIKYYEKCISVLERNEDIYKIARMYDNLGDHYLKTIFSYYLKK